MTSGVSVRTRHSRVRESSVVISRRLEEGTLRDQPSEVRSVGPKERQGTCDVQLRTGPETKSKDLTRKGWIDESCKGVEEVRKRVSSGNAPSGRVGRSSGLDDVGVGCGEGTRRDRGDREILD